MKFMYVYAVLLLTAATTQASTMVETTVFDRGEGGYYGFRIPAVVQAQNGTILAFAEARKNSNSDFGDIDLVVKRSVDGGLTWSPLQIINNNGTSESGNPAPVVDQVTGNIILPFVKDRQIPWVTTSTNGGLTWTTPVDISATAKPATWDGYAFGPNHGIQLERGPNAGRLVIPQNHNLLGQNLEPDGREISMIYSDDGGATWAVGGTLVNPTAGIGPNESNVTELVDGSLYVNARSQGGFSRHRLVGYSNDGGLSFTGQAEFDYGLVDPQVQGSVVRYSAVDQGDAQNRLLFTNPKTQDSRTRLHVRSSFDESLTWNEGKMINRGRSAYSDVVTLNDKKIGVLYEWGNTSSYEEIRFATFTEEWLDDPTVLQLNFDEQESGAAPSTTDYLADSRGYGYHGTASNAPTFVEGDPRYDNGAALRFTAGTDEVRVEDFSNSMMDFQAEDSFTLEAVFKTTSHSSTSAVASGPLISKDIGSGLPSYFLRVQDSRVRFLISDNTSLESLYSDVVVNDGEWHHVAAVRDADAGTISLYIDYVFAGSVVDDTTGDFGNSSDLLIGSFNDSSGTTNKQFVGDIDFVRVSTGALSLSEFVQPLLTGDLDGDGFVGINDLNIVLSNWNQNVPPADPAADPSGDGFVGIDDLNEVLGNWNVGTPPTSSSVPEPNAGLLMLGLSLFLSGKARR